MKETREVLIEQIYNLMGKTLKLPRSGNRGVYYKLEKLKVIRDYLVGEFDKCMK